MSGGEYFFDEIRIDEINCNLIQNVSETYIHLRINNSLIVLWILIKQFAFIELSHDGDTQKSKRLLVNLIAKLLEDLLVPFDLTLREVAKAIVHVEHKEEYCSDKILNH